MTFQAHPTPKLDATRAAIAGAIDGYFTDADPADRRDAEEQAVDGVRDVLVGLLDELELEVRTADAEAGGDGIVRLEVLEDLIEAARIEAGA